MSSFTFAIAGQTPSQLTVTNGLLQGSTGFESMQIAGDRFNVGLDSRSSGRGLVSVSVNAVPEPSSLALLSIGLLAAGLSRLTRRR